MTPPALLTLISEALADQADLTATERFSQRHDAGLLPQSGRWRELLPARPPGPGQQYGFEIDLDACTGCKACVTACRSLNGLDEDESWRSVGLLHGGRDESSLIQHVTAACHHCVDPACLKGCPVDAYEKDPVTGIVHHLDDQCIGCSYCTFTCPYDVPRYNDARGIVRKCDMCSGRLSAGEAPACAQACPNEAIRIVTVDVAEVAARAIAEGALVPGAAPSALTVPTTRYHSRREFPPDLAPVARFAVRAAHRHPPLAVMLVLTQLSVGAFAADLALRATAGTSVAATLRPANATVALALGTLALAASVLHLGRPAYAWRAVIGLRHSWLSREIAAFGAFAGLAVVYAALLGFGAGSPAAVDGLALVVAATGMAGVGCSVMVYATCGRAWWSRRRTATRFALTTAACGLATTLAVALLVALTQGEAAGEAVVAEVAVPLSLLLVAVGAAKLGWEARLLRAATVPDAEIAGSAGLLLGPELVHLTQWRFTLGGIGCIGLPLVLAAVAGAGTRPGLCAALAVASALAVVAGELCERAGFFGAVTSPGMPQELP